MAKNGNSWDLESLIDLEQAAASIQETPPAVRRMVTEAVRGREGAAARRQGLWIWLDEVRQVRAGRRFSTALSLVTLGLSAVAFLGGISAMLGLLDRTKGGVNVTLFLAIVIGGQWLLLVVATVAWLCRQRATEGFSLLQSLAGRLVLKLSGASQDGWWDRLMDGGEAPRAAGLWRLARMAQTAGIFFNLGILSGLTGLVLLKHVGFFWETTTELAMRSGLHAVVQWLALPWSAVWPSAVPGRDVIESTRWLPGNADQLAPGPAAWWQFLLMTTLVWGMLPRVVLWLVAWQAGRLALGRLDFQARHHRALWREITHSPRTLAEDPPLDGVLVLDVGGSGWSEAALRPFLLQHLRVNPAAWRSVAVLDPGKEAEAARDLAKAPAGVVLLAEAWSLSPARMISLHSKIREQAGDEVPIKFLTANLGAGGRPAPVSPEEQAVWTSFVDSLRDPRAEVFFFQGNQRVL
jgi:hypothetical protein